MAVLHLQFDIDSEVHPELHDMLCSIASSRSRAERLCQLAATGLVWERLRLHAYGRIEVPDLGSEPVPAPEGGVSLPDEAAAAPAAQAVPQGDATTARSADLADFVDLSDAVDLAHLDYPDPGPVDERPSGHQDVDHGAATVESEDKAVQLAAGLLLAGNDAPGLPLHEIRSAVQALPVLTEVVAAAELPNMNVRAATANEAAHAGRGSALPASGAQIHELAPARKTATRSRLLRMKEKGLFKNE